MIDMQIQRQYRLLVFLAGLEAEGATLKQPILNRRYSKALANNNAGRECIKCRTYKLWASYYKRGTGYKCICITCYKEQHNKHGLEMTHTESHK